MNHRSHGECDSRGWPRGACYAVGVLVAALGCSSGSSSKVDSGVSSGPGEVGSGEGGGRGDAIADGFAVSDAGGEGDGEVAIERIAFELPVKSYTFDTAAWNLPSGGFPAVQCGDGQVVIDCCNPPAPLQHPDCAVMPQRCEQGLCSLYFPVGVVQRMDLKTEVPALNSFSNQSTITFGLTTVAYAYDSTMNVDLPPVDLYIAPDGVTSASDASAQKFGTTKVIPAGSAGEATLDLTPGGAAVFAAHANRLTPFNVIATTTVVVPSGSRIPSGRVTLIVRGTATATAGL